MKTVKVSEATGPALNWLVAKADDEKDILYAQRQYGRLVIRTAGDHETCDSECSYSPSTDWAQGGPIIEREELHLRKSGCEWQCDYWNDSTLNFDTSYGSTPLIASMRCLVCSKLGDVVDVPDELI
jgi:Protein of unknown function (DUF2591)